MAELESMTPRVSQWLPEEKSREKHWMYRLAKKYFFNDFGVYQNLDRQGRQDSGHLPLGSGS